MFPRALAQAFDLIEADNDQIGKACEVERIERLVATSASEVAQAKSFQLEVSPLFTWR